jgi:DNA-binding GntR family transcriptional regulator
LTDAPRPGPLHDPAPGRGRPEGHATAAYTRYEQVAASIRAQISDGTLKPGDELPGVPELMREYGCANDTLSRARAILAAEGLIVRTPGKVYTVRDDSGAPGGGIPSAPRPSVERVEASLRAAIEAGDLPQGSALPLAGLAATYGCSKPTVTRVLRALAAQGLIARAAPAPYRVGPPGDPDEHALYREVAAKIRERITSGEFGGQLPKIGEICDWTRCSRATAIRALGSLEAEGLVVGVQGLGYFISGPS